MSGQQAIPLSRGIEGVLDRTVFSGEAFFQPPKLEAFFSVKGVARQGRALRIRARQMGELAITDVTH